MEWVEWLKKKENRPQMNGMVGMVLKSLGAKITDEDIAQLEAIIPQIIPKMKETITFINAKCDSFQAQLDALKLHAESEMLLRKQDESIQNTLIESIQETNLKLAELTKTIREGFEGQNGRSTGSASASHEPAANGIAKRKR